MDPQHAGSSLRQRGELYGLSRISSQAACVVDSSTCWIASQRRRAGDTLESVSLVTLAGLADKAERPMES